MRKFLKKDFQRNNLINKKMGIDLENNKIEKPSRVDEVLAELNLTLSLLEDSDVVYLDCSTDSKKGLELSKAHKFLEEVGPEFPEYYIPIDENKIMGGENEVAMVQDSVDSVIYGIRKECCIKIREIVEISRKEEEEVLEIKDLDVPAEEKIIASLTPEEDASLYGRDKTGVGRAVITSAYEIAANFFTSALQDRRKSIETYWNGLFNNSKEAIEILNAYLSGKIDYVQFQARVTSLPTVKIYEEDFNKPLSNLPKNFPVRY